MRTATAAVEKKTDHRRYPRAPVNRPARMSIGDGPPTPTQLMNLSPYGAALFYSKPLANGTGVWLTFSLRTNLKTVTLILPGEVLESQLRGESHLIRIAFTNPPRDAVKTIYEFAQNRVAGE